MMVAGRGRTNRRTTDAHHFVQRRLIMAMQLRTILMVALIAAVVGVEIYMVGWVDGQRLKEIGRE